MQGRQTRRWRCVSLVQRTSGPGREPTARWLEDGAATDLVQGPWGSGSAGNGENGRIRSVAGEGNGRDRCPLRACMWVAAEGERDEGTRGDAR